MGHKIMQYRSWLFVRGDRAAELGESVATGADIVVVDLAGLPDAYSSGEARRNAAQWLAAHRERIVEQTAAGRWVRINALTSRQWREDLLATMPAAPDGIILPLSSGPEDVRQLAAELYEQEQRHHIAPGATRILPVVGETPRAALTITGYLEAPHQRLAGLAWNSDNLGRAVGAMRRRVGKTARWTDAFSHVRAQTLLAANACGLMAIDTAHDDLHDDKVWTAACRESRGDGFSGMFVRTVERVTAINQAFALRDEELQRARSIVSAFENEPDAGTVEIDRRVISREQLKQARHILGLDELVAAPGARAPILRPA